MDYMKKILRAFAFAFAAVVVAVFSGCSKSDDGEATPTTDPSAQGGNTTTALYGMLYCNFTPSADEVAMFDITAEYTDETGNLKKDTVTGAWKKTVVYKTLPVKPTLTIKQALKPGAGYSETANVGFELSCLFSVVSNGKNPFGDKGYYSDGNGSYFRGKNKEQFDKWMTMYATIVDRTFTISNTPDESGYYVFK